MTEVVKTAERQSPIESLLFTGTLNEVATLNALGLDSQKTMAEHIEALKANIAGITELLQITAVSVGAVMAGKAQRWKDEPDLHDLKNKDSKMSLVLSALAEGKFEISAPQTMIQQIPAGNGLFVGHKLNFCLVRIPGLSDPLQLPEACFERA